MTYKTRVRIVTVQGQKYVQAVTGGAGPQIKVHRSFGRMSWESRLQAELYCLARDCLIEITQNEPGTKGYEEFHRDALATFGWILGKEEIGEICHSKLQELP